MKKLTQLFLIASVLFAAGCQKWLDINEDPNRQKEEKIPMPQVLTAATLNVGFTGGSDLQRYGAFIMQHYSGQRESGNETQTQAFEKYLIQATDLNNLFGSMYAASLNDLEIVINEGTKLNSPHYVGVAKILKAYTYHLMVDIWGDLPYSETQQTVKNLFPKYDKAEDIYTNIFKLLDEGIADVGQATSVFSPTTNSTIYSATSFADAKPLWIKFANTLKLRLYLHYSKLNKADAVAKIKALIESGVPMMASTADNFQHAFLSEGRRQNPIHQFELNRVNYLFPNNFLVQLMNGKTDPRRFTYFTQFPANSGNFLGATSGADVSQKFSRIHTYLRGTALNTGTPRADGSYPSTGTGSISYNGAAPIRMLSFAEYNFIRAEAALYGAPGDAETFFKAGITASMKDAGVSDADALTYVTAHGTLAGTDEEKLEQIIEEKYVANYGVAVEPWTDWRRTGYPAIAIPGNAILTAVPRSLLLPQSEVDLNRNAPPQKANMLVRVFWDKE